MIFDKIEKRSDGDLGKWTFSSLFEKGYDVTDNLGESTYFSCLRIISESVAKTGIDIKQETEKGENIIKKHRWYNALNLRCNEYMSITDTLATLVIMYKHYGIGGLYIDRRNNYLYPVRITGCTIDNMGLIKGVKNNKILWDLECVGETGSCFDKDIIILKDTTLDGINTKATKNICSKSLDTSMKAQNYLNNLFTNGLTNRIVCQLSSDVKDEKELRKVQEKFSRIYSNDGKIFTVPAGFTISALNLSLADAEYSELRDKSKIEIATMMGVPLSKLGVKNETAKTNEQDNLDFLSDTLQIIFTKLENEFDYKLLTISESNNGFKIRFNVNSMLRTDAKTQADVITNYVRNGVYTINDARRILGMDKIENGNYVFMPSGQVSIDALINGDVSYMKNNKSTDEGGDIDE